ncbi:MAG: restriction endonuclease subunit S [Anaerolineae bacterium]|jgi:type I restriction enzyme S subunit
MRTELLLEHFALLRTPQDVAQLEAAILDLAVRGELVPQDPDDEPASVLLERIKAEKTRLVNAGKVRKRKALPCLEAGQVPYRLPENWSWIKLDEIAEIASGVTKGRDLSKNKTVTLPYLRVANVQRGYLDLSKIKEIEIKEAEQDKYLLRNGDLLLTEGGDADKLGRSAIWENQIPNCIHQNHIFRARMYLESSAEWIMLCTNSQYGRRYFLGSAKQTTNLASINMTQLRNFPVPFPPFPEQKCIIAKVNELLAQTRALAAQLQAADDALLPTAQTAFQALVGAPPPPPRRAGEQLVPRKTGASAQRRAWERVASAFDALTADPRTIEALKQTLLGLAVQGKLVPQDPDDEPASVLLERVREGKARLVREKKIKKVKRLPPIEAEEVPYRSPQGWEWVRFGTIANIATNLTDPSLFPSLPHIAPNNIEKYTGKLLKYNTVQEDGIRSSNHHFFPGQLLYSKIRPNLSKAVVIDFEGLCSADMYPIDSFIERRYLLVYILSNTFLNMAVGEDTRVAMPKINQAALNNILVAVPPLPEQRRIVAKVEALLGLCDALAAQVVAAEEVRAQLLQAILNGGETTT